VKYVNSSIPKIIFIYAYLLVTYGEMLEGGRISNRQAVFLIHYMLPEIILLT